MNHLNSAESYAGLLQEYRNTRQKLMRVEECLRRALEQTVCRVSEPQVRDRDFSFSGFRDSVEFIRQLSSVSTSAVFDIFLSEPPEELVQTIRSLEYERIELNSALNNLAEELVELEPASIKDAAEKAEFLAMIVYSDPFAETDYFMFKLLSTIRALKRATLSDPLWTSEI